MRGPLTYLYCCSYEGENVHDPNPIDVAAQASGEPTFREVGVGPWSQTHPGEPRPDDASSPNYDIRFDSTLLDEGDRRNVLDRYRYWTVAAIKADLDSRGRTISKSPWRTGPTISTSAPWCAPPTRSKRAACTSSARTNGIARARS